jgi:signal transduction histidine kinase
MGLNGALRERSHAYAVFRIVMDAPETLPPLPAEIEMAAYYIALEALTNVEKHAQAKVCHIRLRLTPADSRTGVRRLELEIADDGRGLAANAAHGLGLLSMRARATEVGGTCEILPNPAGGTVVRMQIPCSLKAP